MPVVGRVSRFLGLLVGLAYTCGAGVLAGEESSDWRLDLLAQEGVPAETAALRKFQQRHKASPALMDDAVGRLGDERFATREQAGHEILSMGREVLPWLRAMPVSDNPEIRMRLGEIERKLTADGVWKTEDLLREAVDSLLRERLDGKNDAASGILFAEFFQHAASPLAESYRKFQFKAGERMDAQVSDGVLRMKGARAGDGDQRLLLQADQLGLGDGFPDSFRVEVRLGGEKGGEGAFHVGVSIGNVKALYHPGYHGGGFRFEQVDDRSQLTSNTQMGFDPSTSELQRMSIDAKRGNEGDVTLEVVVCGGGKSYHNRGVFKKDVIGNVATIGLERSGRTGGDAVFDELVVGRGMP